MAICRICGTRFKANSSSGDGICHNEGCWKKAWNDAIAPFKGKAKSVIPRKNRRTTAEEKKSIIELYKSGMKRKQIANDTDVPYETVCYIIQKYEREEN